MGAEPRRCHAAEHWSESEERELSVRLVLVRHAHTGANGGPGERAVLQGRADLPLSPLGWRQVGLLQRKLRGGPGFGAVYSSPLRRARDTAAALSAVGLGQLHLCPELQEIDCGHLDGMPLGEVQRSFPELWAANLRQTDEDFRWPGGESCREFRNRCVDAVTSLASRHQGRIALVTHAGVIGQVLGWLAGSSPARWEPFRPGNTAITEIEWTNGSGIVIQHDDRGHLTPHAA